MFEADAFFFLLRFLTRSSLFFNDSSSLHASHCLLISSVLRTLARGGNPWFPALCRQSYSRMTAADSAPTSACKMLVDGLRLQTKLATIQRSSIIQKEVFKTDMQVACSLKRYQDISNFCQSCTAMMFMLKAST
ncbi:hypothetical protein M3J09_013165 [Ascochyta lentis]